MTYFEWVAAYDTLTPEKRVELCRECDRFGSRALISILLPVYNPDLRFLDEAIASVTRQIYPHWELCIADDASTNPLVKPYLEATAARDQRIKVTLRKLNGHISACSNSALSLAAGDWCALLDQDDVLAENALVEVNRAIARQSDLGLIYSDEDFLDFSGARSNPFFKPDWNPELFLGQNYLNHLGVYRTDLLREIGGFREGFEGSQDYDLALRCMARLRAGQIHHIPRILYHWRMVAGSLADQPDAKPYARDAARRALNSYLSDAGIAGQAQPCPENDESHRVIYDLPSPLPKVSILQTGPLPVHSIAAKTDYPTLEVVPISSGAAAANAAARSVRGEVLLFLSSQIEITQAGWLKEVISHVVRPEIGAVGARLWSPEGKVEDGGLILGLGGSAAPAFRGFPRGHAGYFNRAWLQQNYSAVSANCMAVRAEFFREMEGFDEKQFPREFYDVDFCLRLRRRGMQVVWTPYADLTYHGSGARGEGAEVAGLQSRWGAELLRDPFYNPNLSLDLPRLFPGGPSSA